MTLVEPGAVATELPTHITHAKTRAMAEQIWAETAIKAKDVAELIAFALSRPTTSPSARSSSGPPNRP
ncbi:hypothetical protein OG927_34620 (plasmid) [Streptomyces clavifer]|uniref:hypothetical protein n=1 Tax=Streptomyces clavifer TaxID=68188 RepID=UPI002E80B3FD|nr:hypothetical protein [Streptomyces clavifer]WUC32494.1 hypothetical protein OG927_34620 [Streptomyces clavifer]